MDLRTFIKETLIQICDGVSEAADEVSLRGAIINPKGTQSVENTTYINSQFRRTVQNVEFDVALTTVEGKGTEGGIGVMIGSIGLGSKGKSDSSATSSSRVKFTVPVSLPASNVD
jgi:enolase